jgi:deazaflavin-dependent oxidoreductase (nitroreductase family)
MKWILRSPLHGMLSKNTMLVTVTGRKSGKPITTPVSYVRIGDVLSVTSFRHRTWWRNLRGSAPVTIRLQGQDLRATGEVIEDEAGVAAGLMAHLQKVPEYARYYQVNLDSGGQPDATDILRTAKDKVVILIRLA